MKEFKLAKGWALFIYIAAPLLIAVFSYLLLMPFLPGAKDEKIGQIYWFLAPLSVGMIALCIIGVVDAVKGRFVIAGDRVYRIGSFTSRELKRHQIKGFRVDDKYIYILPNEKGLKRIRVSLYFGGTAEITGWLAAHFPDLDKQEEEREQQEILSNASLGYTEIERQESLAKAKRRAKALNRAGGLVSVWLLFFPQPYEAAIWAAVVLPVAALLASKYSNGLIRLQEKKNGAYPSVFPAVFFPSLSICIRALMDFNLLRYENAWKGMVLVAALWMTVLLVRSREFRFRSREEYAIAAFFAILALSYGFGTIITLNCIHDQSAVSVYPVQVMGKHVSTGKTTTYYLRLSPWGPQTAENDVPVSKSLYQRMQVNDKALVYLRQGLFGILWFVVTD